MTKKGPPNNTISAPRPLFLTTLPEPKKYRFAFVPPLAAVPYKLPSLPRNRAMLPIPLASVLLNELRAYAVPLPFFCEKPRKPTVQGQQQAPQTRDFHAKMREFHASESDRVSEFLGFFAKGLDGPLPWRVAHNSGQPPGACLEAVSGSHTEQGVPAPPGGARSRSRVWAMAPCQPRRAQPAASSMPNWGQSGGMGRAHSSARANHACRMSSWRARTNHETVRAIAGACRGATRCLPVRDRLC
jgi:hypothetical protein